MIRDLQQMPDSAAVTDLFTRAADYVVLESGQPPDAAQTHDFFTKAPLDIAPETSRHLGFFLPDGLLVAIAEVAFGFPNPDDAYIGLLLIDPAHRGKRLGQQMVNHIVTAARARHATRILIAVLEDNPKGHRFWAKMGFIEELRSKPKQIGLKTHVQIRMARPL
jgi:GNAT superfamily N-acetyltransferase